MKVTRLSPKSVGAHGGRLGPLRWRWGVRLTSDDPRLGGIAGVEFDREYGLIGVTRGGWWLTFEDGDSPQTLRSVGVTRLRDAPGEPRGLVADWSRRVVVDFPDADTSRTYALDVCGVAARGLFEKTESGQIAAEASATVPAPPGYRLIGLSEADRFLPDARPGLADFVSLWRPEGAPDHALLQEYKVRGGERDPAAATLARLPGTVTALTTRFDGKRVQLLLAAEPGTPNALDLFAFDIDEGRTGPDDAPLGSRKRPFFIMKPGAEEAARLRARYPWLNVDPTSVCVTSGGHPGRWTLPAAGEVVTADGSPLPAGAVFDVSLGPRADPTAGGGSGGNDSRFELCIGDEALRRPEAYAFAVRVTRDGVLTHREHEPIRFRPDQPLRLVVEPVTPGPATGGAEAAALRVALDAVKARPDRGSYEQLEQLPDLVRRAGASADDTTMDELLSLVASPDSVVRLWAAAALGEFGPRGVRIAPALETALRREQALYLTAYGADARTGPAWPDTAMCVALRKIDGRVREGCSP